MFRHLCENFWFENTRWDAMAVQLEYFDYLVCKHWVRIVSKFRAIWVSNNDPIEILRAQA